MSLSRFDFLKNLTNLWTREKNAIRTYKIHHFPLANIWMAINLVALAQLMKNKIKIESNILII